MSHFDEKTKVWHGPKVIETRRSLAKELFKHLQKTPNKIAQISVSEKTELTYNEVKVLSIRAAQNLLELGVEPGYMIGIIALNSTFLAPVAFGFFLIGATISPLDPSNSIEEITHMWGITRPKMVFCDPDMVTIVQKVIEDLQLNAEIYTFLEKLEGCHSVNEILKETLKEDDFVPADLPDDALLAVLSSSGTTGAAKGIACTQAYFIRSASIMKMDNTSRVYYIASLFWLGGIKFLLLPFFHNATRIISNTAVVFENIFTMYDDYKITHTFLQPGSLATVMKVMEEKKIQCLNVEHMMCGGSFVYASLRKSFAKSFPNAVMGIAYGTTEVHHLTLLIHDKNAKETLSVGVLRENIQMKIVNEDDIPLGFNQIGDICAKPYKNVFCGYYNNEVATKNAIDSKGFFKTGDLGYFDENGYLFISDRRTDLLKVFNPELINVYPSALENIVVTVKGIKEVCVVGVKHPVFIEIPAVMVIKEKDMHVSEKDISAVLLKTFGVKSFGDEVVIYFMDEFPTTPSGKIKKRLVKVYAMEKFNQAHNYVF